VPKKHERERQQGNAIFSQKLAAGRRVERQTSWNGWIDKEIKVNPAE
jgi:hypothetical protein